MTRPRLGITVSVYDMDSGETLVQANDELPGSTDDDLSITAGGLAYGLEEDLAGVLYAEYGDE